MTTNRAALISKIYKVLKKHYKPVAPPADRSVLEHLLYACVLENARLDSADEAYARLKELYFDWNEIRVTTVTELAEGMAGIPDAADAAQRVKKSLQSIFESTYSFDLEAFKKQNLGKAEKDLEKINGSTPFVRAYVTQNSLGGHSIPLSKGSIEVLYAMGLISEAEADKGQVPGLERAIPKNKGVEFGSLLQQIGADFRASPGSSKLKGILAEVDPDYRDRLVKRQAQLEANAAAQVVAAKEARQKARAEARAALERPAPRPPGKDGPKSGDTAKSKEAAKGKPAPPQPGKKKPDSDGAKPSKPTPGKGLVKKKPR
jgi:hypothetical protein